MKIDLHSVCNYSHWDRNGAEEHFFPRFGVGRSLFHSWLSSRFSFMWCKLMARNYVASDIGFYRSFLLLASSLLSLLFSLSVPFSCASAFLLLSHTHSHSSIFFSFSLPSHSSMSVYSASLSVYLSLPLSLSLLSSPSLSLYFCLSLYIYLPFSSLSLTLPCSFDMFHVSSLGYPLNPKFAILPSPRWRARNFCLLDRNPSSE